MHVKYAETPVPAMLLSVVFAVAACSPLTSPTPSPTVANPSSTRTVFPSPLLSLTSFATRFAMASPTSTQRTLPAPPMAIPPTRLPLTRTPQVVALAEHLSEPDDLLLAPDGSFYFSDVGDGTLNQITRDG